MPIKCFQSAAPKEIDILDECVRNGNLGFGEYVLKFENAFKDFSGLKHNIGFSSATSSAYAIFRFGGV